jgi:hypothetical protein
VQLGVIVPVQPGEQIPGGKAAEFRYLLPQTENGNLDNDIDI